jgi:succinyl-diaminopimelate desuccinylase
MVASAVELTQELVRFETINPPGNELECIRHLGKLLQDADLQITYHDFGEGRANLIARTGGTSDKAALCFTGHVDTVPLGLQPWSVDPFAADISDGKVWGRGTTDMKAGVAAFTVAAINLAKHLPGTPGLELAITAGEETGCAGALDLGQKANALGRVGAIVVAEPSSNQAWVGHKGALWLLATSSGVTAHGSMPDKGVNAVYKAARAISKLEAFDFNVARHPVLGGPTLNVGTVHGGINFNSVPDRAEFGIDIRTIPGQGHANLRAQIASYLGEDITVQPIIDLAGIWTEPDTDWIADVFEVVSDATGRPSTVEAAPYFTDASVLTPAYGNPPTVIVGPGEAAMAHQTDEYCYVERIDQAVDIYASIARRWCGI